MTSDKTPSDGVQLVQYDNVWFRRGRPLLVEVLWLVVQALFIRSWIPGAAHRRSFLRLFGAKIGRGVDIKPGVRVKFPWRLRIGDHSWIGEAVWLDSLAVIDIGSNCCISQGAYLCTGSHDWRDRYFGLTVNPIKIGDGAWIAAKAMVGPGVSVGEGAILSLGSAAFHDLAPWTIYQGIPAIAVRKRQLSTGSDNEQPR